MRGLARYLTMALVISLFIKEIESWGQYSLRLKKHIAMYLQLILQRLDSLRRLSQAHQSLRLSTYSLIKK